MVTRWGMCEEVGALYLEEDHAQGLPRAGSEPLEYRYGRSLADLADQQVRESVNRACTEAFDLLKRERSRLDALAGALLAEETLDQQRMREVLGLPDRRGSMLPKVLPAVVR